MALYFIENAVCTSTIQRNSNKFYGIIVYRNKFFAVFKYISLFKYIFNYHYFSEMGCRIYLGDGQS